MTGADHAARANPVQLADKPVDESGATHACVDRQTEQLAVLEEKKGEAADATVTKIQAAIRAATDADVPLEDSCHFGRVLSGGNLRENPTHGQHGPAGAAECARATALPPARRLTACSRPGPG